MRDLQIALADRPGALAEMGETLGRAGISLLGGGVFHGVAHFLVHDGDAAQTALEAQGISVVANREVLVQKLRQGEPGQLGKFARALANAGVNMAGAFTAAAPVSAMLGITLGLLVGKPLGIFGLTWLAVKMRVAELPEGLNWGRVAIAGCFGGIGFTMSIFVTSLAFTQNATIGSAKGAVLIASVAAAVALYEVSQQRSGITPSE